MLRSVHMKGQNLHVLDFILDQIMAVQEKNLVRLNMRQSYRICCETVHMEHNKEEQLHRFSKLHGVPPQSVTIRHGGGWHSTEFGGFMLDKCVSALHTQTRHQLLEYTPYLRLSCG